MDTNFPLIRVSGNARQRGRAHGEELHDSIARGLELWFEYLRHPERTIERFLRETSHLEAASRHTPTVVDEIHGIAEGAGVPFETLFVYNLADEQQVFLGATREKCTAVGLRRPVPVSGQTMDTPSWFDETKIAVAAHEKETGLDILVFTIAGIVALCGVNSAGVSVWCNAVYQLPGSTAGVPVSSVARTALSQPTIGEANAFVRNVPHASGQNYVIGSPDGIVSLECCARSVVEARGEGDAVWHTNHPVANPDADDPSGDASSLARDAFAAERLRQALDTTDVRHVLEDTTTPICKVGGDESSGFGYTLWGIAVEHTVPPHVWATPGPPALFGWQKVDVGPPVSA